MVLNKAHVEPEAKPNQRKPAPRFIFKVTSETSEMWKFWNCGKFHKLHCVLFSKDSAMQTKKGTRTNVVPFKVTNTVCQEISHLEF